MEVIAPADETDRLSALERYEVLDTPRDEAFDRITRLASKIFQAPIALISLVDKDRQWFKSRLGLDAAETSREIAFCAHAMQSDTVMVVENAIRDPRFEKNPLVIGEPRIRFYAGAPLLTPDGQNLGTLCIMGPRPRALDAEQATMLKDLAAMVIDELELRLLASTDSLTGALNRRYFMDLADREQRRAVRYHTPLSVFLIDVDLFKNINDTHGHEAGDAILKRLTAICNDTLREPDLICRFGGEEFAILLPQTDAQGALQVAERLRHAIADARIAIGEKTIECTASIGVASLQPDNGTIQAVLSRADKALYAAKAAGRNRVVLAEGS